MKPLLFVTLFAVCALASTFDPSRCKFVDSTPVLNNGAANYLFRGNEPIDSSGNFAWSELNSTFHELVPNLPNEYVMIDICLLNVSEFGDEETEKRFFNRNPQLGTYYNWPIWGNALMVIYF